MKMRLKNFDSAGLALLLTLSAAAFAQSESPSHSPEGQPLGEVQNPFVKPCVYKQSLSAQWRHEFHHMRTTWDKYFVVWPKELDGYEATTLEKIKAEPAFYLEKNVRFDVYWGKPGSFYRPFTAPFHEVGYVNFGAWNYGTELWLKDAREQVLLLFYADRRKKDLIDKLNALPMYTPVHLWAQVRSKSEGLPWIEIKGAEIIPETAPSDSCLRFLELGVKQMTRKRYELAAQSFDAALRLQVPVNIETRAFSLLGRSLYELRMYPEARNAYAESLLRDDSNVSNLIYLARSDAYVQNYEEMRDASERAVALAPANPEARAELGLALAMLGDMKAGLRELEFAQRLAPRNQLPEANRNRAVIALHDNKLELAKQELSQAVILRASDPNLHMELGEVLLKMNQLDDAKREFGFAKELAPTRSEPYFKFALISRVQGDVLKKDGKTDDAKKLFGDALENVRSAIKYDPDNENARALEIDMLKELGRDKEAEKSIDTALAKWPANAPLQIARYDIAVRLGKWDVMEESAQKLLALKPDIKSYMRLANVLAGKPSPDYSAAASNYEAALKLDPASGTAWFELAYVKLNLGDAEGGVAAADRAVELMKSPESKLLAARVRLERAALDPSVETIANLLLEEFKDDAIRAQALAILGAAQLKAGDANKAADNFAKANSVLKDDAEFQFWFGQALLKKSEPDLAKAHLKSGVEIARNSSTQSALLNKLVQSAIVEIEKLEPGYHSRLPEPGKSSAVGLGKDPTARTPVMITEKPVIRKVLPPLIEDDGPQLIPTELDRPNK